jgi:hypothetical protein
LAPDCPLDDFAFGGPLIGAEESIRVLLVALVVDVSGFVTVTEVIIGGVLGGGGVPEEVPESVPLGLIFDGIK